MKKKSRSRTKRWADYGNRTAIHFIALPVPAVYSDSYGDETTVVKTSASAQ